MRDLVRGLLCLTLFVLMPWLSGCGTAAQVTDLMPRNDSGWLVQEVEFRKAVDLLLVVDDGPSMEPKQAAFERGFHALLEVFFSPWNNVDLQIAQVSTRIGVRSSATGSCRARPLELSYLHTPSGDPLTWSCEPASEDALTGGYRMGPGAVRSCLGSFGNSGCGPNAALGRMHQALRQPLSSWVRDDAVLAMVFLSDDRDCSIPGSARALPGKRSEIGQEKALSEHCFSMGARCQGEADGSYAQCEIRDRSGAQAFAPRLLSYQEVVDDLFALKDNQYDQVIALSISGVSDQEESKVVYPLPRSKEHQAPELGCVRWTLAHAQQGAAERWLGAHAPIRLRAIAEETTTADERALYSICVDDLRRSLHEIASQVMRRVRPVCVFETLLHRETASGSRVPYCDVIEKSPEGEWVIPECERGEDGAYLVDAGGEGLARPSGAVRCVSYKSDLQGDRSADPHDDMSSQCRLQKAQLEVELHGEMVPRSEQDVHWSLRCARIAQ